MWLNKLRPVPHSGMADGMVDPWIKLMNTYLRDACIDDIFKAGIILNHLTKEGKSYMGAKPDDQKATPEQVYDLLRRRFGEVSHDAARLTFETRVQAPDEEEGAYLDVVEALRSQAYPEGSSKDREKTIVRKFISGVRDADLKRLLLSLSMTWDMSSEHLTVEQVCITVAGDLRL